MSGDAPDARKSAWAEHGCYPNPDKEDSVALTQVKLLEGVFTDVRFARRSTAWRVPASSPTQEIAWS